MHLQTARLVLRSFTAADLEWLCPLTANDDFMQFSPGVMTPEQTKTMLDKFLGWDRAGAPSQFAMIEPKTARLFGFCGFLHQEVDGEKEIEIGYRLHPEFWNRGFATEAARAVRDYAFRELQLERVISLIHEDNHASRRVAEKNGMRLDKRTSFKGFPTLVFAITQAGWRELARAAG